jgi:FSR family fosmidomycin resistance protein-like MFS transporter
MPETSLNDRKDSMPKSRRVLITGCFAHFAHDGLTDMIYIFLPIWQQAFGLTFAQTGLLRTAFSGTLALFQMLSGLLAKRIGIVSVLACGTCLTGASLFTIGLFPWPVLLGALLALGGLGSSTQHPLASSAIAQVYRGEASRAALSTYNFSGDVGKFVVPLLASFLIAYEGWQGAISVLGLFGILSGAVIFVALIKVQLETTVDVGRKHLRGFASIFRQNASQLASLSIIGIIDNGTRGGFLTFLPFLLKGKGAGTSSIALALSLVFAGGAMGKLFCGILAVRVGVLRSVIITEILTAVFIFSLVSLSLESALMLCPFLGVALNGTSSILYGSVPELVSPEHRNEAFAFFYTCTIGAGALSPFLYGMLSDAIGIPDTITVIAGLVLIIIPLTRLLKGRVGN